MMPATQQLVKSSALPPVVEGEVISPHGDGPGWLDVVAATRPFAVEVIQRRIPAGQTLIEIVREACGAEILTRHARVWIDDVAIPRENWRRVRPKPGHHVIIRVVPGGGGGGSGGKSPLRIILSLAVVAASFVLGPALGGVLGSAVMGSAWAAASASTVAIFNAVGSALISIVGSTLVNAFVPAPRAALAQASGLAQIAATSPTLSITGAANRANPYGPVPRVFGRHRVFPLNGAAQYTEIVGDDQYLRCLFDLGYGPLALEDHRIGATPLAQFEGVEMEFRQGYAADAPIGLYSNQIVEEPQTLKLTAAGGRQILESRDDADELSFDIGFQGLVQFGAQGQRVARSVTLRIEVRRAGSADAWEKAVDPRAPQASSAAALTAVPDGEAHAEYRTDHLLGGPLSLTLTTVVGSTRYGYRVKARPMGDADWVLHQTIAPGGSGAVNLVGRTGRKLEIRIECDGTANVGGAPGFPAPSFSYPALVPADITITAATEQVVRRTFIANPDVTGRFEIGFTRLTADSTDATVRDECGVTALRTIRYTAPIRAPGHCQVALKIKATNQLQGLIQQYNCIAQALLPVHDGVAWSAPVATRLPAWAALEVLRGSANKRPIPDAKLDLPAWRELAVANAEADQNGEPRHLFDAVFDTRSTVLQAVNDILATCRASLSMKDGKYAPVRDVKQSVPVQLFTPRNSWGFKASKLFIRHPHALKCRYVNPAKDWSQDEVAVYADGYTKDNATLFETVDLWGLTRGAQAWRHGRQMEAEAKLRPEKYRLFCDLEHLVARRGSLVRVGHDVPRWGLAWGRIKAVTLDGGAIVAITLDERVTIEAGKSYAVRVRNSQNGQAFAALQTSGTTIETSVLTLLQPMAAEDAAVGDLACFGEAGRETVELIVRSVARMGDYNAQLELIDAAPALHDADRGPIPAFDTQSSWPGQGVNRAPPRPAVTDVRSDEDAMTLLPGGGWAAAIRLTLATSSGVGVPVRYTEVQLRRATAGDSWERRTWPGAPSVVYVEGIDEGETYDLRVRAVAEGGAGSDWFPVDGHRVVGRSTKPPRYPRVVVENGLLVADYPNPPRDFAGCRIDYHRGVQRVRAGAASAHPATPTVALPFDLSQLPAGTLTLFVLAVDTSGNESEPAIIVRDFEGPVIENIVDEADLAAAGFPGTIVNGEVVGGVLRALPVPGQLFLSGTGPFLPGDGPFLPADYRELQWTASFVPDWIDVPSQLTIAANVTAESFRIEHRGSDGSLFLPGDGPFLPGTGPFLPHDPPFGPMPAAIAAKHIRHEFRVTASASAIRAQIAGFTIRLDVPDEEELLEDIVVPPTGIRLPLVRAYRQLRNVGLTLQDDGNGADSVRWVDKDPAADATLGPLIKAFAGGVAATALVDARIKGVKA